MIAVIRVLKNGQGYTLCDLDLMKFTEEQVRDRMFERGISDDAFFVSGIKDWNIDTIMSLKEAYLLKRCIEELYDGDDYIVRFLLNSHQTVAQIISVHYLYYSKDELEVMGYMLRHVEPLALLENFQKTWSWDNFVRSYQQTGHLLVTPKGIFLSSDLL